MKGLWPIGAPALGGLGAALLLSHWLPTTIALACACACAFFIGHKRMGGWKARWRKSERQRRYQKLPLPQRKTYRPVKTPEGVFELGVYLGGDPVQWKPWDGGEQHLFVAGITGGGKSVTLKNLIATARENWDWEVVVIDAKKANEFRWAERELGITLIRDERSKMAKCLEEQAEEIERRRDELTQFGVIRSGPDGVERWVDPDKLRDFDPAERERLGIKPRLVIFDEAAIELMEDKRGGLIHEPLKRCLAQGRYVGIHFVISAQRGGVEVISGFASHLLGAKILLGVTSDVTERMVFGAGEGEVLTTLAAEMGVEINALERAMRGPGACAAQGLEAGRAFSVAQLDEFDPILYGRPVFPEAQATTASSPSPFSAPAPSASGDASGEAALSGPVADPEAGPPVGGSGDALRGWRRLTTVLPWPAKPEACGPRRYGASLRQPLALARRPSRGDGSGGSAPAASAASQRLARAVWRVRVKVWAWRWRAAPRVRAGARDRSIPRVALEEYGRVCAVCGETRPPLDVDHRQPIQFGGPDVLANVWVLCGVCHSYKTDAENWAKRERTLKRSKLFRVALPNFGWSPWVVLGLGVLGWGVFSRWTGTWPHPLIPAVVLGVLAVWKWKTRDKGINRAPALELLAEKRMFRPGTPAGAELRARIALTIASASVQTTLAGGAFLWLVGWFLAGRIG